MSSTDGRAGMFAATTYIEVCCNNIHRGMLLQRLQRLWLSGIYYIMSRHFRVHFSEARPSVFSIIQRNYYRVYLREAGECVLLLLL